MQQIFFYTIGTVFLLEQTFPYCLINPPLLKIFTQSIFHGYQYPFIIIRSKRKFDSLRFDTI